MCLESSVDQPKQEECQVMNAKTISNEPGTSVKTVSDDSVIKAQEV